MTTHTNWFALIAPLLAWLSQAQAGDDSVARSAVERGLAMVTQAATRWPKNKTCFACHHQTLPMLAAVEASKVGFPIDPAWLNAQADITHRYFDERTDLLDAGDHIPGSATTLGFAFWALSLDERKSDAVTTLMARYLLQVQGVERTRDRKPDAPPNLEDGRWMGSCRRPPMQDSYVGDTVLVLMGLEEYMAESQRAAVEKSRAAAEAWLAQAPLHSQQDRLWRVWGLHHLGGDESVKKTTLSELMSAQNDDGGWGEDTDRPQSDAYTTGQALFMLIKTGTPRDTPQLLRAHDWLLRTQSTDGSWKVVTHTQIKGQRYFDNGDPHGESQFLSIAATAWATAALARMLNPIPQPP